MIAKQRLEELIEQSATIYSVDTSNKTILSFKICKNENDIKLTEKQYAFFEKCFETKGEAEWHAEFGCIERTDRLELPTWEKLQNEIEKNGCYGCEIFFMGFDEKKEPMQYVLDVRPDDKIYIGFAKEIGAKVLDIEFEALTTKENYTLACRKCKELFLGESE